jgi:hypothetical protein
MPKLAPTILRDAPAHMLVGDVIDARGRFKPVGEVGKIPIEGPIAGAGRGGSRGFSPENPGPLRKIIAEEARLGRKLTKAETDKIFGPPSAKDIADAKRSNAMTPEQQFKHLEQLGKEGKFDVQGFAKMADRMQPKAQPPLHERMRADPELTTWAQKNGYPVDTVLKAATQLRDSHGVSNEAIKYYFTLIRQRGGI